MYPGLGWSIRTAQAARSCTCTNNLGETCRGWLLTMLQLVAKSCSKDFLLDFQIQHAQHALLLFLLLLLLLPACQPAAPVNQGVLGCWFLEIHVATDRASATM